MSAQSFPDRLKILIGDMNRSEFARKCDIPESSIRKYLGGSQPRMDVLVQIAEGTGASIEWIASGRGAPYKPPSAQEITPNVRQNLDMKEQYVQAIFRRMYELQEQSDAHINADSFYYSLVMIHQVLLDKFGGADATDEQLEAVLTDYVDKLAKQAGWFKTNRK